MKSFTHLLIFSFILLLAGASCTKEGAQGPAGANGEDGVNGIDGESGTSGCIQCHTSDEDMEVKSAQWAVSGHVLGGHMSGFYASRDGCADCHSSQGFQEVVATGVWDGPAPTSPLPANCYTCHQIHETYTSDDWAFRLGESVDLLTNGLATAQGSANTCVQCHQSRIAEPVLDISGDATVAITSQRYGPHHGPQGNAMAGAGVSGAYELDGTMTYVNSAHASSESTNCVSCHMASNAGSSGNMAMGNHSNNVAVGSWDDESRVVNANGCVECHNEYPDNSSITAFVASSRNDNLALINNLKDKLLSMGYINDSNYVLGDDGESNASSDNPLNVSTKHAAAIYNYKFVVEDQSALIHNPKYSKALIQNSLEALDQ